MQNLSEKKLALFFSRGVSLKTWQEIGSFSREVKPYCQLAKVFKEIYFFTYGAKEDLRFQKVLAGNIKIFPRNCSSSLYYFFLPLFRRKELKEAAFYKTNQMSAALPALVAKWLYKKKLIVRCGYEWLQVLEKEKKAGWKRILVALLERTAYNKADKIILASEKDKLFVQKRFKVEEGKIAVIPNYIDTELFKGLAELNFANSWRSLTPPDTARHRQGVVYVGRLSKEKNLLNLIEAVGELKEKLILFGKGPLENELRTLARERRANVEFRGKVPNEKLPQELNKAKVFVLPSFYESSPKALLEAMSCGLCCVASDIEGINEVIRHKENGFLCGTSAEKIKEALEAVLGDEQLRERLGQAARQTIVQRFSLEYILNKEITFYLSLSS